MPIGLSDIELIPRDIYIRKIIPYIDKPLIKVITGIRRSGKSAILELVEKYLTESGIQKDRIIKINFDSLSTKKIQTAETLYEYIKASIKEKGHCYVLLDEIQEVVDWEKAVRSFFSEGHDVYITGSNSRLLSSELSTYLTGRYIEIKVQTLTFGEYLIFKETRTGKKSEDIHAEFQDYMKLGGFPVIHSGGYDVDSSLNIVADIFNSAVLKDTVQRFGIRNIELLERIIQFIFDNIGNTFSAKSIADYFKSQHRRLDINTVYNYLNALESAFIVKKVSRYNIIGKEILKTHEKYYVSDISLIYALMGYKDHMISGILENIVYLELLSRDYKVYVGKLNSLEIDFIAEKRNEKIYIQVTYRMDKNKETFDREFAPLLSIQDQYPKYVVSSDDVFSDNVEGVKHIHIADFLLRKDYS